MIRIYACRKPADSMIYKHSALHFECTHCGACCQGGDEHYVAINRADLTRIRRYLGISEAWLKRRYVRFFSPSFYTLRFTDKNHCVFLNRDNTCRIYAVRPVQCRTYPWWPELLASKKAWHQEARRCEGIDNGKRVAVNRIIASLRQQLAFEEDSE